MRLHEHLPFIYSSIFPKDFLQAEFFERAANCDKCTMAEKGIYKASLKCCTYYPFWVNFLIGEALTLLDPKAEGLKRLKQIVSRRQFATPLGFVAPPAYQMEFSFTSSLDYGKKPELLCPFFDRGNCSIWRHRGGECASFICMSSYGDRGKSFWSELGTWLYKIEMVLSQHAMIELGFDHLCLEENLQLIKINNFEPSHQSLKFMDKKEWQKIWGPWLGRELTYYQKCYEWALEHGANLVRELTPPIQSFKDMIQPNS